MRSINNNRRPNKNKGWVSDKWKNREDKQEHWKVWNNSQKRLCQTFSRLLGRDESIGTLNQRCWGWWKLSISFYCRFLAWRWEISQTIEEVGCADYGWKLRLFCTFYWGWHNIWLVFEGDVVRWGMGWKSRIAGTFISFRS